jgi:hypothetical protein
VLLFKLSDLLLEDSLVLNCHVKLGPKVIDLLSSLLALKLLSHTGELFLNLSQLGFKLGASLSLFGSPIFVLPRFVFKFFHHFLGLGLELFFSLSVGVDSSLKFGILSLPQGFQSGLLSTKRCS